MPHLDGQRLALCATSEDQTNLQAIAEAVRKSSRTSFLTTSDTLRSALRAAAVLAHRGDLSAVLARYRADLAGG